MKMMRAIVNRNAMSLAVVAVVAWSLGSPAIALEDNQVRGEVVDVRPEQNQIRLEVSEAGADRSAREGRIETYEFDEDTRIRMEEPRESILNPLALTIDNLESGTNVLLDFEEIDGRRMARNVSVEDGQGADSASTAGAGRGDSSTDTSHSDSGSSRSELAAVESNVSDERSSLPSTASMLPALAAFGCLFAGIALVLRLRRR